MTIPIHRKQWLLVAVEAARKREYCTNGTRVGPQTHRKCRGRAGTTARVIAAQEPRK